MMKRIFTILFTLSFTLSFAQTTSTFEEITLEVDTFLNGSDGSGGFSNGNIFLPNNYIDDPQYPSWSGWSISNSTDTETPGFGNQYSSANGTGYDGSSNYAVSFVGGESRMILEGDATGEIVNGMYVTNAAFARLSMLEGDAFAKKFGGADGTEPDFFVLTIKGYLNGELSTEQVDFYLADFRFEDDAQDYIIEDWTYVDLTSLGQVDSLQFTMNSSDIGNYGMNTPAYFCADNVETSDGIDPATSTIDPFKLDFEIYPNPSADQIWIKNLEGEKVDFAIFDMMGRVVFNNTITDFQSSINIDFLPQGSFLIKVQDGEKFSTKILIKK